MAASFLMVNEEDFCTNILIHRDTVRALCDSLEQAVFATNRADEEKFHTQAQSDLRFLLRFIAGNCVRSLTALGVDYQSSLMTMGVYGKARRYVQHTTEEPDPQLANELFLDLHGFVRSSDSVSLLEWRASVME
jgi:hypothetical protein